ncbi:MAG TPA: hypothetical protein VJI52_02415 [Candidatus Nanoarchaeia archaeon]|nr:hypothetical protein [Candidatus Nanoarchaeia archaeon]
MAKEITIPSLEQYASIFHAHSCALNAGAQVMQDSTLNLAVKKLYDAVNEAYRRLTPEERIAILDKAVPHHSSTSVHGLEITRELEEILDIMVE